ncbi:MAG: protein arginine kinase [candidate division Zixibacteria bacterium]|nr:protein arginine kinase [candidate division Zixibacteria bacterium]
MLTFEDMANSLSGWLSGEGEESMVVLSTRVRMARNLQNTIYPAAAEEGVKSSVIGYFESAQGRSKELSEGKLMKASELGGIDRDFLVERHLMSPTFMQDNSSRALYVRGDEMLSVMINEEDHFRIQALAPALNLDQALQIATEFENELGRYLEFDYDSDFGFLTACPTNVGTGMRASVLIHLPGLVITKDIDRVIARISKMGVTVRGFYGEGTDVLGNLFQVSNQTTLGITERQILELIDRVTRSIIKEEAAARERLINEALKQTEDKIWRAFGILKHARMLTSDEVMNLLSAVRLGVAMNIIDFLDISAINEMLLLSQPAHLQKYYRKELSPDERDFVRAELIRNRLA